MSFVREHNRVMAVLIEVLVDTIPLDRYDTIWRSEPADWRKTGKSDGLRVELGVKSDSLRVELGVNQPIQTLSTVWARRSR
jgi:hypothetical protein